MQKGYLKTNFGIALCYIQDYGYLAIFGGLFCFKNSAKDFIL